MQVSLFTTTKKAMMRRKRFLKNIQRLKTFGMQNLTIFWLEDKRESDWITDADFSYTYYIMGSKIFNSLLAFFPTYIMLWKFLVEITVSQREIHTKHVLLLLHGCHKTRLWIRVGVKSHCLKLKNEYCKSSIQTLQSTCTSISFGNYIHI